MPFPMVFRYMTIQISFFCITTVTKWTFVWLYPFMDCNNVPFHASFKIKAGITSATTIWLLFLIPNMCMILSWNLNGFFFSWIVMFYCNSEISNVTFEGSSSLHEPTLCVFSDLVSTWILHRMKCTEKFSFLHELSCVISIDL